jgi:hypothetical protein
MIFISFHVVNPRPFLPQALARALPIEVTSQIFQVTRRGFRAGDNHHKFVELKEVNNIETVMDNHL